jgi:ATP-dependent helicase/nuclease subunit B
MNQKFLDKVADHLLQKHNGDFSEVIVVVPSGRARLYLLRYLENKMKKVFWTPEFFTLPEFVGRIHGGKMGGELELTLAMYSLWSFEGKLSDTFSEFLKWSSIAMKDFNEIDASMADANRVFADLRSIREIEDWSMNGENLSPAQMKYATFWLELGKLYLSYVQWQQENDTYTYQRMTRVLAESDSLDVGMLEKKSIYVIGISGFSIAEKKLLDKITERIVTEVIWDVDAFYINDGMHEAGENYRKSGYAMPLNWIGNSFLEHEKNIEVYECGTSVTQVLKASQLLGEMSEEVLNDTCVVLADESMFDPFITSLSELPVPVNLSIGVPLKQNSIYRLLDAILGIRSSNARLNKGIYHTEFIRVLQLMRQLEIIDEESDAIQKQIISDVKIYIDDEYLNNLKVNDHIGSGALRLLSTRVSNKEWVALSIELVNRIKPNEELTAAGTQKLLNVLQEIDALQKSYDFLEEAEALHLLYSRIGGSLTVHYEGKPGAGLEVMNMVETRSMDFSNVMVLGANEDVLPGNLFDQSYIPIDLRAYYKLPLPIVRESTYAYTFYRFLQKADNIHLFYSSISSDFRGTEQSRYITQIENELVTANARINFVRKNIRTIQYKASTQVAPNDDFVKDRLDKLFAYGISPSAINKYIACPLDFYYRYIVGLGEEEQVEETMSSATFGSVVHYVLENFYASFIGKFPSESDFISLQASLNERIEEALLKLYSVQNTTTGENYLQKSLAVSMLNKFIEFEMNALKLRSDGGVQAKIREVETMMKREVDVAAHDWNKPVVLRGKIDRIDEIGKEVHIIDYKTGKVKAKDVVMSGSLQDLFTKKDNAKTIQLLIYIYMYGERIEDIENIRAGLYSLIDMQSGYQFMRLKNGSIDTTFMECFEIEFINWVKSVYSCSEFTHNPESRYCEYCI